MNYQQKTKDKLIEELQILEKEYNSLILSYKKDIAEYEQTNKRLQESENKYSILINNANNSIWVVQDGLVIFVNPKTLSLLEGYNEQELIGKPFNDIIFKDDRNMVVENYRRRLACEVVPDTYNFRIITPAGVVKWVEIHVTYISWNGKPALMNFLTNITERKLAEQDLLNIKESLENLTKHLDDVRENERMSIARDIHDHFSQSLTFLKMDLKWLYSKMDKGSEEATKLLEMIEVANKAGEVAQRISSELRSPILDDLGLSATIEWYCEKIVKKTGLEINMELDEVQSENTYNNLTIYRVLQEALTNIIRHAKAKTVQIKLSEIDNNIVLYIQDEGIGIPPDKIKSAKSLGLIGMFERVRQSGGHLEITSMVKGGTNIIVYIPK